MRFRIVSSNDAQLVLDDQAALHIDGLLQILRMHGLTFQETTDRISELFG